MKAIVYTRHDGGVSVDYPCEEEFRRMQLGGYWDAQPRGFIDRQIELQISSGIAPDHARRYANAIAFGGVTEADAWGILRDRNCARHGILHELIDPSELPGRWFRNAWCRSANGGPVGVDLEKARRIQWQKIKAAVADEERRSETDLDMWSRQIDVPWLTIESAIRHASDEGELRRVWPEI